MSVERKSLFIELFVQSHLVLSSIAEEKLKHRSQAILQFDSNPDVSEIQNESDYLHHLEYVRHLILKSVDKAYKAAPEEPATSLSEVISQIENATSGETLYRIIENIQG